MQQHHPKTISKCINIKILCSNKNLDIYFVSFSFSFSIHTHFILHRNMRRPKESHECVIQYWCEKETCKPRRGDTKLACKLA